MDVKNDAQVITTNSGDIITSNGNESIALPVGLAGQVLTVNTAGDAIEWQTPDISEILTAGDGLEITGSNVINVIGSDTILAISSPASVAVRSNNVSNNILLSSGTNTSPATWSALPINDPNAITGTLSIENGGTGLAVVSPLDGNRLIVTNSAGTAFEVSDISPPIQGTITTNDATSTTILTIPVADNTAYTLDAYFLARQDDGSNIASFRIKSTINVVAGSASVLGINDYLYTPTNTPWEAAVTTSGTTITLSVTGSAATDINWIARVDPLISI